MSKHRLIILIVCLGSGFSALLCELVWSRMMVPVFGNTQSATGLTAAVFMAGLGIGGFLGGKLAEALGNRIQALQRYALVEAGIGIFALGFPFWYRLAAEVHLSITPDITLHPHWVGLIRLGFFFILLLPPTIMMGATFPLLGAAFVQDPRRTGRDTALVYGINTLGGTIGVLAGGFYLIRVWGGNTCLFIAGALSLTLALMVWAAARGVSSARTGLLKKAEPKTDFQPYDPADTKKTILILSGAGLAGFCALAYEVLWTRLLVLVMQNSVYAFSLILAGFLAGIGLGSLLTPLLLKFIRRPALLFGMIQVTAGIACLAVSLGFNLPDRPGDISYLAFLLAGPFFMVLVPMIFSGTLVPLAAAVVGSEGTGAGRTLGNVYCVNSLGAVTGGLLTGFLLMPHLGCRLTIILLFSLQILAGAFITAFSMGSSVKLRLLIGLPAAGMVCLAAVLLPSDLVRQYYERPASSETMVWYAEGKAATASVTRTPSGEQILYLNGIAEVTNNLPAIRTFRLMALLPYVMHPDPDNALMITFGAGISAGLAVHLYPDVACIEINETCTDIAQLYKRENKNVMDAENLALHLTDGRNYLRHSDTSHSVIISDATHPHSYDSWILFTREFYRLCSDRLDSGGIFCQWLPFHGLAPEQFRIILNTVRHVFPEVTLWTVDNAYCLMIAGRHKVKVDPARLAETVSRKDIRPFLSPVGLDNPYRILGCYVTGSRGLNRLLANETLINTDNLPHNQFFPLGVNGFKRLEWHRQNLRQLFQYKNFN